MKRRVQFEFSEQTYSAIRKLAERTGETSMAGVIRDALKVYAWLMDEQMAGRKIVSVDSKDESRRELVPLAMG